MSQFIIHFFDILKIFHTYLSCFLICEMKLEIEITIPVVKMNKITTTNDFKIIELLYNNAWIN